MTESKPRRIFITADTIGGVWTYTMELARALAAQGIDIALATMGRTLSYDQRRKCRQIPRLQVYESAYKLEWMENPWDDIESAKLWLLNLEKLVCPDVVHLNQFSFGNLPWSAPAIVVGHSCVLSWCKAVKGEEAPPTWDRYTKEVRNGLQAAAMVIAPTHTMLTSLMSYYGPFRRSLVIYNGRDRSRFLPGNKQNFVLTAGRLRDEAKNIRLLKSIAARLPWPVYVAGESGAGHNGSMSNMHYLTFLPSSILAMWYSKAAIYCLPARYEPFGLSALEAALAGCALVLGNIPSLQELWKDAAIFVNPENPHELEDTIAWLIRNDSYRRNLASVARARALQFTPQRMLQSYMDAYRHVRLPAEVQQIDHTAS